MLKKSLIFFKENYGNYGGNFPNQDSYSGNPSFLSEAAVKNNSHNVKKKYFEEKENEKLMKKMMEKQSELIQKLAEVRQNNKLKKDQMYNEELRNKINILESKLMFKKFENDQMNFLIDLKKGSEDK